MSVQRFITDTLDFYKLEQYPLETLEKELQQEDDLLRGDRDELEYIVAKGYSTGKLAQLVNDRRRRIAHLKSVIDKKQKA